MAYNPERMVHFRMGAVTHLHMLAMGQSQQLPAVHLANARLAGKQGDQEGRERNMDRFKSALHAHTHIREDVKPAPAESGMRPQGVPSAPLGDKNMIRAKVIPERGKENLN